MQMKSIASRPFKYGGVLVQPQSEFSVKSARDAKVLAAARRAALLVAPPPQVAVAPAAPASKRSYKRRDMVSESAAAPALPLALPNEPAAQVPAFDSFMSEPPATDREQDAES